jgi:hypothetical protein
MKDTLMLRKKGGFHPTLQGREIHEAVGPFRSSPRRSRNNRTSFFRGHGRKKKRRSRGYRERKELRKKATMEDREKELSKNEQ